MAREEKPVIGVLYGFRALMVLFVCNYHIWQQGWLGQYITLFGHEFDFDFFTRSSYLFVDGMLLLSGFLLYLPYAGRASNAPPPRVPRFYFNRAVRIAPSFLLSVGVMLAASWGAYSGGAARAKDVLTHLTFTFNFWPDTYLFTPLNVALWTIAVEAQFYLIFPLLARAARRKPALTLSLMALAGWLYRAATNLWAKDTALYVNQMPAFLDVYALGMLGAMGWTRLTRLREAASGAARRIVPWAMAAAFIVSCWAICELVHAQTVAGLAGPAALRLSQLRLRLPFALTMLTAMLSASQMPKVLQRLLDNRLTRFLAAVSFNLYIWHQPLSVWLKGMFPASLHSEHAQQVAYTLSALSLSLIVAMLVTFGWEQPIARLANRLRVTRGKKDIA